MYAEEPPTGPENAVLRYLSVLDALVEGAQKVQLFAEWAMQVVVKLKEYWQLVLVDDYPIRIRVEFVAEGQSWSAEDGESGTILVAVPVRRARPGAAIEIPLELRDYDALEVRLRNCVLNRYAPEIAGFGLQLLNLY